MTYTEDFGYVEIKWVEGGCTMKGAIKVMGRREHLSSASSASRRIELIRVEMAREPGGVLRLRLV